MKTVNRHGSQCHFGNELSSAVAIRRFMLTIGSLTSAQSGEFEMDKLPKRVTEIVERLKQGEPSRRYKVRAVLKWFGASRRGANILSDIKTVLINLGMESEPAIDTVDIDEHIRFVLSSPTIANQERNSVDLTAKPFAPAIPDA